MSDIYDEYIKLLDSYLAGSINAERFQSEYLAKFKAEERPINEELYELLDALFADVDAFCSDPNLLAELKKTNIGWYLDEKELRECVSAILKSIKKIKNKGNSSATPPAL